MLLLITAKMEILLIIRMIIIIVHFLIILHQIETIVILFKWKNQIGLKIIDLILIQLNLIVHLFFDLRVYIILHLKLIKFLLIIAKLRKLDLL